MRACRVEISAAQQRVGMSADTARKSAGATLALPTYGVIYARILVTLFRKYSRVFRSNRSLTVAAPIRAARVSKRLSDTLGNF